VNEAKYLVDVDDLRGVLGQPGIRIIDCRFELSDPGAGYAAYLSGHIPGAVYADLDRDLAGPIGPATGRHPMPEAERMTATIERLGIDNSTRVIVYDDSSGAIAARAWWLLRWLGHDEAAILDGGIRAWQDRALPLEEGVTAVPEGRFVPAPRNNLVLSTAEILAAGGAAASLRLVDVRAEERYTGREEPIDRVPGHIPGSLNLPFTENLHEDGRWKSAGEIRRRLATTLGPPSDQDWSVMCGSGVTACHLVMAGLLAGYAEPRVYVGSWSEWITDPSRPIATGWEAGEGAAWKSAEDS
jgi:thiosulfate/3-mercaptopyruvate sulfurtransferase